VGHEVDFTIADFVADARAPTPTAAAELLSPDQEEWAAQFRAWEARLARLLRDRLRQRAQHLDWLGARLIHPRQRLQLLAQRLSALRQHLAHAQLARLQAARAALAALRLRLQERSPLARLRAAEPQLRHVAARLLRALQQRIDGGRERLSALGQTLNALSPLATLARGYAIVTLADGRVVRDARQAQVGGAVVARVANGELDCRVEAVRAR
jgi:exodeoxyribonuclease VII large subunit